MLKKFKNLTGNFFRFAVCLIFLAIAIPSSAEYLFLKDGSIINCKVIEETPVYITIKTDKENNEIYTQDKVLRVLYTELNMGKIYVQLKNGKSMRVFMVDEDRNTYTFRKDIYKPEEFKIKRAEVMFITERNPSGLKGEPELYSITLTWYQSFEKMEKFNIYIKKKQDENFTLIGESEEIRYVVKNLNSNTNYIIRITGIDGENLETAPSNEIEILTKNLPPFRPEKAFYEKQKNGDYFLQWDSAEDSDGRVVNYIIYRLWNNKTEKFARTSANELLIKGPVNFEKLYVRAVDDRGADSLSRVFDEYIYRVPTAPEKVLFEKLGDGNYQLTWDKSKGRIEKYIISKIYNNKREKVAETIETELLLEKTNKFESLYVKAVDNRGAESPERIFNESKNKIPSNTEKDSARYFLKDGKDRFIEVSFSGIPGDEAKKRVKDLKNLFSGWGRITAGNIEFYFTSDGIYPKIKIKKISYNEENLIPYLPAGLSFHDKKDGLHYILHISVDNKSYILNGIYIDEENFLKEINSSIIKKQNKEQTQTVEKPEIKEDDKVKKVQHRLSASLDVNYLIPTGLWADLFSGGYGFMAGVTLNNAGISINDKTIFHLDFSLLIGYHQLMSKATLPGSTSFINTAFMVPICLYSRYNFNIINLFFISLKLGVGINFNNIEYSQQQNSGGYTPAAIRQWAPSISLGLQIGYPVIKDKIMLLAGAEYRWMFERSMTSDSILFQLGVEYSFTVFGK